MMEYLKLKLLGDLIITIIFILALFGPIIVKLDKEEVTQNLITNEEVKDEQG